MLWTTTTRQKRNSMLRHNLDHVIKEKLNTATDSACGIQTNRFHNAANQSIQPFHSQYFILNKGPHNLSPFILLYRNISMFSIVYGPQFPAA